jgi:hypothetical protein
MITIARQPTWTSISILGSLSQPFETFAYLESSVARETGAAVVMVRVRLWDFQC